ncbi:DnaJ domain-containing protein [Globomyces pollinis-pini]|nr:DnaJ domain-containing protein [Globomyces pollinis-pini]
MASSIELDYYAILEIDYTASEKEIRKAYRKKSLTCHPDKVGPDDEKAANTFHLINLAVDALTDPVKRKLYDDLHKAERMRKERFNDMNAARRAERTKLEEREQAAKKAKHEHLSKDAQDKLEMERIREEGVQKMLARSEIKRQEMASSMNRAQQIKDANEVIKNASVADCTIKIKWSKELSGAVDEVRIRNSFSTYGIIDKVLMGKSGKRNAVLVFKNVQDSVS